MSKKTLKAQSYDAAYRSMRERIMMTWGRGFDILGENLRRAIIAECVLHVFAGRDENAVVSVALMNEYKSEMLSRFGIE